MPSSLASVLLVITIAATILPPGYPAYIGAYVALIAAILAFLVYSWRERVAFSHPTSLAILAAILLVGGALPFAIAARRTGTGLFPDPGAVAGPE